MSKRASFNAEEGKSAAVTLRLAEPWHDKCPRIVLADAWFGGLLTVFALLLRGLFCIVNVKLQTKHFCKRELWACARVITAHMSAIPKHIGS
jgi:hypothetical protein